MRCKCIRDQISLRPDINDWVFVGNIYEYEQGKNVYFVYGMGGSDFFLEDKFNEYFIDVSVYRDRRIREVLGD